MLKKLQSESVKHILTLFSGNVLAQIFSMLIYIYLTDIYSVYEHGLIALYLSFISPLSVIATGRYDIAIVKAPNDTEAKHLIQLSFTLVLLIAFIVGLVTFLFNSTIANGLGDPNIGKYLYLAPFSVIFNGSFEITSNHYNRLKRYKEMTTPRVFQSLLIGGSQSTGNHFQWNGMILGNLIGRGTTVIAMFCQWFLKVRDLKLFSNFSYRNLKQIANQYKTYPIINGAHILSDTLRETYAAIFITKFYGEKLGLFAITLKLLKTPLMFISSAIGKVFFKNGTEYYENKTLFSKSLGLAKNLALLGLPVFILIYLFAGDVFAWIYGNTWRDSGIYAQSLTLLFFFNFICSPLSVLTFILEKQQFFFVLNLIKSSIYVAVFYFGGKSGLSFLQTLIWLNLLMSILNAVNLAYFLYFASKSDKA